MNASASRWIELDWIRGLAVAGMILVVSPGSWSHRLSQLDHAVWNGFTLADLVMPLFLFAVGVAISLSKPSTASFAKALRRTVVLVVLGLFINLLPNFDVEHWRIPGVLLRIACCYFMAFIVWKITLGKPGRLIAVIVALLLGNSLLMNFVPVPGFGAGNLSPEGNLAAYIDRAVFGVSHMWAYGTAPGLGVVYDPDGILSNLFASTNAVFGCVVGSALKKPHASNHSLRWIIIAVLLIGLVMALNYVVPINKSLWSVSFALLTMGLSVLIFVGLAFLSQYQLRCFYPVQVLGCNAILAFILSSILLAYSGVPVVGEQGIQTWIFNIVTTFISNPWGASFLCSLLVLVVITGLLLPLHRRRIFVRI